MKKKKMKTLALYLLLILLSVYQAESKDNDRPNRPTISFTFDDGITKDLAGYKFENWNDMILSALSEEGLKAVFFVTGSNKLDDKGKYLLNTWSNYGHKIANHSFTHLISIIQS